jgi:type 1 fimbria pilin
MKPALNHGWGRWAGWSLWALWALWPLLGLGTAWSQSATGTEAGSLKISGLIKQGSCQLPLLTVSNPNPYVLNLPPLQTVQLMNSGVGKITPLKLKLNTTSGCLTLSGMNAQLSFDGGMAAVVPNGGLLRNVATLRPAQNVYVQLGLLSPTGLFTPLDLNDPQALNAALNAKPNADGSPPGDTMLNLGVRYVTARNSGDQLASLINLWPGSEDVMPGNVSVFLPFVLNHN